MNSKHDTRVLTQVDVHIVNSEQWDATHPYSDEVRDLDRITRSHVGHQTLLKCSLTNRRPRVTLTNTLQATRPSEMRYDSQR